MKTKKEIEASLRQWKELKKPTCAEFETIIKTLEWVLK